MMHIYNIITSTYQERFEQYSHPLYKGTVDVNDDSKFSVIPPGVNTNIFTTVDSDGDDAIYSSIEKKIQGTKRPYIVVSSRLDEKKNIIGVVKAYALSKELQEKSNLGIFIRGLDDPYSEISNLTETEQSILKPILDITGQDSIKDKVHFFNLQSQKELAATYRYFAKLASVFALTAFYEPFGLAPIEAAACGLSVVATKNGGPSEIFEDGSGVLVDPFDDKDISAGLLRGVNEYSHFSDLGIKRVKAKYTWAKTAEAYFEVIKSGAEKPRDRDINVPGLDGKKLLLDYLTERAAK